MSAAQALDEAFGVVAGFFSLNSRGVTSTNITSETPSPGTLDSETLYGFYLAGLSSWTAWINKENNRAVHTTYTSINLAQRMYEDIRYDGLLNGLVSNTAGDGSMELVLENVALNADAYRLAFSLHMLAVASNTQNKTGIDSQNQDLINAAQTIAAASTEATLFPVGSEIPLSDPSFGVQVAESQHNGIYGRQYRFDIDVTSLLGAERIDIRLDNPQSDPIQTLLAQDAPVANVQIDDQIAAGPDCQHTIYVTAVNILGDEATTNFNACFDWDAPTVEINSEPYANTSVFNMAGSFTDVGSVNAVVGLQSITITLVQSQTSIEADITPADADSITGSWSAALQGLVAGENPLQIVVTDKVGNRFQMSHSIYLDDQEPTLVIGGSEGHHGQVRYSDGTDGFIMEPLQSVNTATPLYIESNRTDFPVAANNTQQLQNTFIPFYRFTVSDVRAPSVFADPGNITVELQYEKQTGAGTVLVDDWHVIGNTQTVGYRNCDNPSSTCEYYVPLASPFLNTNWDQTTPSEVHTLKVRVTDAANNQTETQFQFLAGIIVPAIAINEPPVNLGNEVFSLYNGTDFANRADLLSQPLTFDSTQYSFTNPSNKAIYVYLEDLGSTTSTHVVTQNLEQWLREHTVRRRTEFEWQIRQIVPTTTSCPLAGNWTPVNNVYDYNGDSWDLLSKPQPITENTNILQDNIPDPYSSAWADLPQDDNVHRTVTLNLTSPPRTWNFTVDYAVSEPNFGTEPAAYISNWSYQQGSGTPQTCSGADSERYFFQQRESYTYSRLDGPRDVITAVDPPIMEGFNTAGFTVIDLENQTVLVPVNGWYRIRPNAQVRVIKTVTAPALQVHEGDFTIPASYTTASIRDSSITWSVSRKLTLTAIHDAGEDNIVSMPQRETTTDMGMMQYTITRN